MMLLMSVLLELISIIGGECVRFDEGVILGVGGIGGRGEIGGILLANVLVRVGGRVGLL